MISRDTLAKIILDYISVDMKNTILDIAKKKLANTPLESKALQLEKQYTSRKRKFHKNKNIKNYEPKDKEFMHFIKAIEIIKRHKTTTKVFLDSQLEGLKFANNFRGLYPKPNHLSTMGAEERLLEYLTQRDGDGHVEKIDRIELSRFDRETELMENHKFVAKWELLDKGKADLRDVYYIKDCMIARKGSATRKVKEYIKKLESENEQ